MKKLTLLLALALVLSLAACGGGTRPDTGDVGGVEPSANVSGGDVSAAPEATPEPVEPSAPAPFSAGQAISAGVDLTLGICPDGTLVSTDGSFAAIPISNAVAIAVGRESTAAVLHPSGAVTVLSNNIDPQDTADWRVTAIDMGYDQLVGLRADGTVVAVGTNLAGECEVESWTDIVAVAAAYAQTAGLRSDGTVVMTGVNRDGQCEVGDWTDITAVAVGNAHTVGLKSDGTVVAVGNNDYGQCDVEGWTDIVAIAAGSAHTLGLRSDGTVIAIGNNEDGQCGVESWTDIVVIDAAFRQSVGLRSDGSVVAVGWNRDGQCNVEGWVLRVPEQ